MLFIKHVASKRNVKFACKEIDNNAGLQLTPKLFGRLLNSNIKLLETEVNKWKGLFEKICDAIDKVLGRTPTNNAKDYEKLADFINYGYYRKNNKKDKSNDLER